MHIYMDMYTCICMYIYIYTFDCVYFYAYMCMGIHMCMDSYLSN